MRFNVRDVPCEPFTMRKGDEEVLAAVPKQHRNLDLIEAEAPSAVSFTFVVPPALEALADGVPIDSGQVLGQLTGQNGSVNLGQERSHEVVHVGGLDRSYLLGLSPHVLLMGLGTSL